MFKKSNKLGLGTVQFGLDYGISNKSGKTSLEEVKKILQQAAESNVTIIDTAQAYGLSENVLGKAGVEKFNVVTKISADGNIQTSLENLQLDSVYAVLAHRADDLIESSLLWDKFALYKEQGLVKKIGVSVYNSEQIDNVLSRYDIDIIQLPVNIYDQRLIKNGYLKKLKQRGIEIHARSAFLQGLLLMSAAELPDYFMSIREHHERYSKFLKSNNLNVIQAALQFLYSVNEIDMVISGVNNIRQFNELVDIACDVNINYDCFEQFAIDDINIIDPVNWKV